MRFSCLPSRTIQSGITIGSSCNCRIRIWCELDHSLPFLQVELHSEIVGLARQLAGDDEIYFRNGGINELAPGRSFPWHGDSGYDYVEFMHYYFSDARRENGCLRVIPGSYIGSVDGLMEEVKGLRQQQLGSSDPLGQNRADVELPREVALEIDFYQMIARSSRIFHATYVNQTQKSRLMHHWLFREAFADNHRFDFTKYLTPALIERLPPEQREALWLGREFSIDSKWTGERERELGKVFWLV